MSAHLTRRRLLRPLAAALPLAPALARREAAAWRGWCRADPVVKIDGQTAHVYVSAHVRNRAEARRRITGRPRLVLRVPPGVGTEYVAGDRSFGYKFDVSFQESAELAATEAEVPVEVAAYVPTDDDPANPMPIRVAFKPVGGGPPGKGDGPAAARRPVRRLRPGAGEGRANEWVRFRAPAEGPPDVGRDRHREGGPR